MLRIDNVLVNDRVEDAIKRHRNKIVNRMIEDGCDYLDVLTVQRSSDSVILSDIIHKFLDTNEI